MYKTFLVNQKEYFYHTNNADDVIKQYNQSLFSNNRLSIYYDINTGIFTIDTLKTDISDNIITLSMTKRIEFYYLCDGTKTHPDMPDNCYYNLFDTLALYIENKNEIHIF